MSSTADHLSAASTKAIAPRSKSQTVQVEFGGQKVDVPKGGYYDRYRMNPNLDEVAQDPNIGHDIAFLRKIPKKLVDSRVGQVYAPNFYYRTSSVQLVILAPLDQLKSKLPAPLEPLTALPGYGLVALTFYSYLVCDNDPYNEMDNHDIKADITATDGTPDLRLDVPLPALRSIPSESQIGTNNAVNKIDGKWYQVAVQTNPLLATQSLFPTNVKLTRNEGPLSQLLNELGVSTIVRMDVIKDAQMVLNMPTPLKVFNRVGSLA
ncbi:hypothetical protein CBS11852_9155 [Aspergillus niger]|nr:hypothetical protein CBS11852_9155 [Aspergillus niger]